MFIVLNRQFYFVKKQITGNDCQFLMYTSILLLNKTRKIVWHINNNSDNILVLLSVNDSSVRVHYK